MSTNLEDVTQKELAFKQLKKSIPNDKALQAFQYAILEAGNWYKAARILDNSNYLDVQTATCYLVASELCLKGIIMYHNGTESLNKYGHNLKMLFDDLDIKHQETIRAEVNYDIEVPFGLTDEKICFNSFDEELDFINKDFIYLRYSYEKYLNGHPVIVLGSFIERMSKSIYSMAYNLLLESNKMFNEVNQ